LIVVVKIVGASMGRGPSGVRRKTYKIASGRIVNKEDDVEDVVRMM